jgi:hypothetical protein
LPNDQVDEVEHVAEAEKIGEERMHQRLHPKTQVRAHDEPVDGLQGRVFHRMNRRDRGAQPEIEHVHGRGVERSQKRQLRSRSSP